MSIAVLLAEPDYEFALSIREDLNKKSISTEIVQNGVEWQSKVLEKKYSFIVLNYALNNNNPDMLKLLNHDPGNTIIFLAIDERDKPGMDAGILEHKNVTQILPFPYSFEQLFNHINNFTNNPPLKRSPLCSKINVIRTLTHKVLSEIYASGLNEKRIDYLEQIGTSTSALIQKEKDLYLALQAYNDYDSPLTTQPFLVMFFSLCICKKLQWHSHRTVSALALASLLHDIGMTSLPLEIRQIPPEDMDNNQLAIYQKHPLLGVEILREFDRISAPVLQIVLQHHEKNGKGFPNQLSDSKIYPLAKVVSLADHFSRALIKSQTTPIKGLKAFLSDRTEIMQFDTEIIKALIKCFINEDETQEKQK